jgi:hypothetical protein
MRVQLFATCFRRPFFPDAVADAVSQFLRASKRRG